MGVNWMEALEAGIGGAATQVGNEMQRREQFAQQQQLKAQQAQIDRQREYFMESLKAPAEKSDLVNDPDPTKSAQGWKNKNTYAWQMPTLDGQPGYYKQIGTESIPPHWEVKDGVAMGDGVKGSIVINPDTFNPSDPNSYTVLGKDSTERQRTMIEQANSATEAGRLSEETRYHNAELAARQGKTDSPMGAESTFAGPGGEVYTGRFKVDDSGQIVPVTTGSGIPLAAPKYDRGAGGYTSSDVDKLNDYLNRKNPQFVDPSNPASASQHPPLQQLSPPNARAGSTPQTMSAPGAQGGGGAGTSTQPAQPAKATQGPGGAGGKTWVARKPNGDGTYTYRYSDGTTGSSPQG